MRKLFWLMLVILLFVLGITGLGVWRKKNAMPVWFSSGYVLFQVSPIDYFLDGFELVKDTFVGLGDKKVQRRLAMERTFYLVEDADTGEPMVVGKIAKDLIVTSLNDGSVDGVMVGGNKKESYKLTDYFKYLGKQCLNEMNVLDVDAAINIETGVGLENVFLKFPYANEWLDISPDDKTYIARDVEGGDFVKIFADPLTGEAMAGVLYKKICE